MSVENLDRPIPNLSRLRKIKDDYRLFPIDAADPRYAEPLVPLSEYGITGNSYYSRPNKATGEPLPGIKPEPLVRRGVAERLSRAKDELWQSDGLAKLVDGRAELIVKDALRSHGLQGHLFEVVWPNLLRELNPEWSEARIQEELPKVVGRPSDDLSSPTPHMTGGAVDVDLVNEDGSAIDFGHIRGNSYISATDYHEGYEIVDDHPINMVARGVRRALYWAMGEQGFTNHPYEFWHYSYGDQMWALFNNQPAAFYGAVEGTPDLHQ
jgi:D-alanyl-D-alanine dipeptidase